MRAHSLSPALRSSKGKNDPTGVAGIDVLLCRMQAGSNPARCSGGGVAAGPPTPILEEGLRGLVVTRGSAVSQSDSGDTSCDRMALLTRRRHFTARAPAPFPL